MPPPRRAARRRFAAAAAESPRAVRGSRRLSVRHGEPFKLEGRCGGGGGDDDDDGLPLSDEALLLVFSSLSFTTADLVRCAATCRRWRRLVSADAAFVCPRATPRSDPCIRSLALGFFHSHTTDGGVSVTQPRFVPLSAAASRLQPSFAALLDDGGASRVVASRNGRLVLDLRRCANTTVTHAVRLGVCNPVTGGGGVGLDVLPQLRGKDSPTGPYACTVITAADERGGGDRRMMTRYSSYRVLLLYNRRGFTALRCYSSDEGSWGPEAEVTGARIGRTQLAVGPHAAVVHRGVVFWPRLAVALRLDSLLQPAPAVSAAKTPPRYTVAGFSPATTRQRHSSTMVTHRLLGVMPGGGLLRVEADMETIRAYWGGRKDGDGDIVDGGCLLGEALKWRWTKMQALMKVHTVRLRWLCEKSGLIIFTARNNSDSDTHVYTLDVETEEIRRVATAPGGESSLEEMCAYEMDRVTLLASLAR